MAKIDLPRFLIQAFKFLGEVTIFVLNFIPLPRVKVYSKKSFPEYCHTYGQSYKTYNILSDYCCHLGTFLLAFNRGKYQTVTVYDIEPIKKKYKKGPFNNCVFICDSHEVKSKIRVKAVSEKDCKILSKR